MMKALESGERWDDEIKGYFPKERMVYLIVDTKDDETINQGVQIYAAPIKKVHKVGVLPLCKKPRSKEVIDISDPTHELEVIFSREGTSLEGTSYGGFKTDKSQLSIEEVKEFMKDVPDKFEEILNPAPYDEIKEAFEGMSGGDGLSDETDVPVDQDEEKPSRAGRGRSRKPREEVKASDTDDQEALPEEDERSQKKRKLREEVRNRSRRSGSNG
jgi:hypothetical protein